MTNGAPNIHSHSGRGEKIIERKDLPARWPAKLRAGAVWKRLI